MREPEGSAADPTTLRATGVRDGDDWVINGHKWFTSGAIGSSFAIVMCVTDPEGSTYRRMSQIIVPPDTPGVQVGRGGAGGGRVPFGSPRAQKQTVQNWIADSVAEIQAARLLTLHAAQKVDQGDEARVEISLIKFFGAKVLHDVIDRAIQVHGALGVSGDTPLEGMYRQARAARIYDGPDEVHRMVVARRVLQQFSQGNTWDFE